MKMDTETEIKQILFSTNVELDSFLKRLETSEQRLTDQDLGDVVSVLERRWRALGARLRKVLARNDDYHMPGKFKKQILQDILVLQDKAMKAKVEFATGQQAAFWSVLKKIEQILEKPGRSVDRALPEIEEGLQEAA